MNTDTKNKDFDFLFNTQSLFKELNFVLENGLKNLLKDFIDRYILLEESHKRIRDALDYSDTHISIDKNTNKANELNGELELKDIYSILKKMSDRMDEMSNEIKEIKTSNHNKGQTIYVKRETEEVFQKETEPVIQIKTEQKENIRLEIEDNESHIEEEVSQQMEMDLELDEEQEVEEVV
jgi:hypothetical protein